MADIDIKAFNPDNYPVEGDGSTDDFANIQYILDNTTLGAVRFPEGSYKISKTLMVNKPLTIYFSEGAKLVIDPTFATDVSAWDDATPYTVGTRVKSSGDNGFAYECTVAGTSGGSEPTWPLVIDNTVSDNTVTWKCIARKWVASKVFPLGARITLASDNGYAYECIDDGTSAGSPPTWPTIIGDTVVDGSVTWQCVASKEAMHVSSSNVQIYGLTIDGTHLPERSAYFEGDEPTPEGIGIKVLNRLRDTTYSISTTDRTSNVVTITTDDDHKLKVGERVRISGVTNYSRAIQDVERSSNVVTIYSSGHLFSVGEYVVISGLDGEDAKTCNGTFKITSIASGVFTFDQTGDDFSTGSYAGTATLAVTFNGLFTIASVPSTRTFTYEQTAVDRDSSDGTATPVLENVLLSGGKVYNCPFPGVWLEYADNCIVENMSVNYCSWNAVPVNTPASINCYYDCDRPLITGCSVSNSGMKGIGFTYVNNGIMSNNYVAFGLNSGHASLYATQSNGCSIIGNSVNDNCGIKVGKNCSNIVVADNVLRNPLEIGIMLQGCRKVNVANNVIQDAQDSCQGITIQSDSACDLDNIQVQNNIIQHLDATSADYGIMLQSAYENRYVKRVRIEGNTIEAFEYGIKCFTDAADRYQDINVRGNNLRAGSNAKFNLGILLYGKRHLIESNIIDGVDTASAIELVSSTSENNEYVRVLNNTVKNVTADHAIYASSSLTANYLEISNNYIDMSAQGFQGIYVDNAKATTMVVNGNTLVCGTVTDGMTMDFDANTDCTLVCSNNILIGSDKNINFATESQVVDGVLMNNICAGITNKPSAPRQHYPWDGTEFSPANVIKNGNVEIWSSGGSSAPDNWTLSGASATVAQSSAAVKIGTYSAALTRVGTDCFLLQDVHGDKGLDYWKGKTVTFSCWVKCATANVARIRISDNVSAPYSSYHTGSDTWELLTVTTTINPSTATLLRVYCRIDTSNATAYFDGAMLVEGETAFPLRG